MTRVAERKTQIQAETSAAYRGRPLMILIQPHGVLIREKGRRESYSVPWLAVHELGMRLAARAAEEGKNVARRKKP